MSKLSSSKLEAPEEEAASKALDEATEVLGPPATQHFSPGHAALVCECVHQLVVVQVDGTGARDELVDLAFVVTLVLHAVIHPRLDIGGVDGEIIG